jgi:hypothetical protein
MNIKTIIGIALLSAIAAFIISPATIPTIKNKVVNTVFAQNDVNTTKPTPVEILQEKHKELTNRYIKLNKRLYVIDNKIDAVKATVSKIEKSNKTGQSVNENGEVIIENPVEYANYSNHKKCLDAMVKSKDRLDIVKTKYESTLKNYKANIEIVKNKMVLQETMSDLNSYMREFNIDSPDLSTENILNNTTALDELILEEEAEYDALNKLSEFENEI